MRYIPSLCMLLTLGCSDYKLNSNSDNDAEAPDDSTPDEDTPEDTGGDTPTDTPEDTGGDTPADTGDTVEITEEECNGKDDDGDGEVDEGFDLNKNGLADCLEEEQYCTPFDNFDKWNYTGSGSWRIESGMLTEGRSGLYDAIAWLYDLGTADRFSIEVDVAWTGSLNDYTGVAWGVSGGNAFVVRWDDPQGDYGRYTPTGAIDLSYCVKGACEVLAQDDRVDLFRTADQTFSTMTVSVDKDTVTVTIDGVVALEATEPTVLGSGPAVVGLYSNDNDGGVWFDDFCVWTEAP